jgi:hypothetical protein
MQANKDSVEGAGGMKSPTFATASLGTAAFLVAGRHLRLVDTDVSDPMHARFVFEDPEAQGSALEAGFLTAGALVPGAEFHRQLRVLRRLIEDRAATRERASTQRATFNSQGFKENGYIERF